MSTGWQWKVWCIALALAAACGGLNRPKSPGPAGGKADNTIPDEAGDETVQSFWKLHVIDGSGSGADGVDVADVNGDGLPDVTSGWTESGSVNVYVNPGPGAVEGAWPGVAVDGGLDVRGAVEDAVFADLDGDGVIDGVVSANEGSVNRVGVHWLTHPSTLLSSFAWTGTWLGQYSYNKLHLKVAVGQIDGQNGNDVVVGSMDGFLTSGKIIWFRAPQQLGPDTASEWRRYEIGSVNKISGIRILDMDGDGDNDVVYTGIGRLRWRENPGSKKINKHDDWEGHTIDETGVKDLSLCDLDQDGEQDLLVAATGVADHADEVLAYWYRRLDPSGFKWERYAISASGGAPGKFAHKGVACADFDLDGKIDVVLTGSEEGHGVYGLSYQGETPRYSGQWSMWLVDEHRDVMKYDNVIAVDLDGDGDQDVLTTEENVGKDSRGLGVVWFENPHL